MAAGTEDGPDQEALTEAFEAERPRLVALATRVLDDHAEAEDVVQQAWLRLAGTDVEIASPPAWLTTVTTRLCLDRLRARTPVPVAELPEVGSHDTSGPVGPADPVDPEELAVLADTVAVALHVVLDRLGPRERVAFVLHDTFGFAFPTIAALLGTTPAAARKLASRARAKVAQPAAEDRLAEAAVVDAFMAAAREGDLERLLRLLAPDAVVGADAAALAAGTPARIEGREAVAAFFDGSARGALPVQLDGRPGAAWVHRGEVRVLFDVEVHEGRVAAITFRADPDVLARVVRRTAAVTPGPPRSSAGGEHDPDPDHRRNP